MKPFLQKIASPFKRASAFFAGSAFPVNLLFLIGISLFLNFFAEICCRHSLLGTLWFLISRPHLFLFGTLIILTTLSVSLLFRRRSQTALTLTLIWIILSVVNLVVLLSRSAPLSFVDFRVARVAFNLITVYLGWPLLILIILAAVAVIALLVLFFLRGPKSKVCFRTAIPILLVLFSVTVSLFAIFTCTNAFPVYKEDRLENTYHRYGFAYCFARSTFDQGVEKPKDYDPEAEREKLRESFESISYETNEIIPVITPEERKPNLIFIQLESFMDVNRIGGVTFSENPTPNFSRMKEEGVSGYLGVPTLGGGTANVEFEVLTGMNLNDFGLGEYPFSTVLRTKACETLATDLRNLGYASHAIHNHTAVFYDRNLAYAGLGFDSFTPIEMMTGVETNPLGWAKDKILTEYILAAMDMTESPDLVFTVTVQGHGKYPEEGLREPDAYLPDGAPAEQHIELEGIDDKDLSHQYHYYINQLHETDVFLGSLLDELKKRSEPTIVVAYGDHLPPLTISETALTGGLYESEYVIWANYDYLGVSDPNVFDRDLTANCLTAYVQMLCGYEEGDITLLHQIELRNGLDLGESLKQLEYAQLYDPDATVCYTPTDITYGIFPITVTDAYLDGTTLTVKGTRFNSATRVKIGALTYTPELIDEETLTVRGLIFGAEEISVSQVSTDGTRLVTLTRPVRPIDQNQ